MDDGLVGGDVDAAVFFRGGEAEDVVVLVDGAAHGAQAVVAVGEHVGHGEFLHAGGARRLDNADIGDVVAGQAVKAHAQVLHVAALVMSLEDAVGHRALLAFFLRDAAAAQAGQLRRIGDNLRAVNQIDAAVIEFDHVFPLLIRMFTDVWDDKNVGNMQIDLDQFYKSLVIWLSIFYNTMGIGASGKMIWALSEKTMAPISGRF